MEILKGTSQSVALAGLPRVKGCGRLVEAPLLVRCRVLWGHVPLRVGQRRALGGCNGQRVSWL